MWLRSPANGAEPALKACTDNTLKSGTYLSHGGTLSLDDRCLDQALIVDALEKSDELIGSFRTVQNPIQLKGEKVVQSKSDEPEQLEENQESEDKKQESSEEKPDKSEKSISSDQANE